MCDACALKAIDDVAAFAAKIGDSPELNPLLTPNADIVKGTGFETGYHEFPVTRPTLLVPLTTPVAILRAYPGKPPTSGDANVTLRGYRSRGGRLYLPFPAVWRIRYFSTSDLPVLRLDNLCGAAMQELGRWTMAKPTRAKTTVTVAATNIISSVDMDSEGTVIMNVGVARVYLRLDSVAADPAVVGDDLYIDPGGIMNLTCPPLQWPGLVNGIADGASSNVITWRVY